MTDNQTPKDNKIFNQLDKDKLKQEIKTEALKEAKNDLISSIQGKKAKYSWEESGKTKPESYDELFGEIDKRSVKSEDVDKIVDQRLKDRDEATFKKQEDVRKQKDTEIKQRAKDFDKDWYALVQEGKMPAPTKEVQDKINKGEKLTKKEIMNDEGLKARLDLAKITQNKSAKLAFYEDYGKQPAGAKAPVLGARPSSPQKETKELQYEDTARNRKRLFGF